MVEILSGGGGVRMSVPRPVRTHKSEFSVHVLRFDGEQDLRRIEVACFESGDKLLFAREAVLP